MSLLHPSAAPKGRSVRSRVGKVAALAVVGMGLVGCNVDNQPPGYNDTVKANLIATCTGRIPNASTTTLLSSPEYCECVYNVFVKGVPFNAKARDEGAVPGYPADKETFDELEKRLKDEPGGYANLVPSGVIEQMKACPQNTAAGPKSGENTGTSAATGSAPGSTAPTTPGSGSGSTPER